LRRWTSLREMVRMSIAIPTPKVIRKAC
jgi:hypothetical protein